MPALFEDVLKQRHIPYQKNVEAKNLCTLRIGGRCRYLLEPLCLGDLVECVRLCRFFGVPYHVIGRGSNILFSDKPQPCALIRTVALNACRIEGHCLIGDCGVTLPQLARRAALGGFGDLTFAAGIPGTLGGGVLMNAGAHEKCIGDLVEWVKAFDPASGKIRTLFNKQLSFSYRNSVFKVNNCIILQACLRLQRRGDPASFAAEIKTALRQRAATQPLDLPSAGSVFLRTDEGVSMGKIIDELGLKGTRCKGAVISPKHGGFIVNLGDAKAVDVCRLINIVKATVKRERGFVPKTEICMIGIEDV